MFILLADIVKTERQYP